MMEAVSFCEISVWQRSVKVIRLSFLKNNV